jgi:hypothetical protein
MHQTWSRTIARTAGLAAVAWLTLAPAWAVADLRFEDSVDDAAKRYADRAAAPDARRAALEGHLSQANAMLMQLVPDDRKTAADWFVVGNMLFRADIAASESAMKKAEALLPDEPAILLERGMAEHRAHHCAAALGYYDRFHATNAGRDHFISWAYSTQCRLVLGDSTKARADWAHARFGQHHTAIEEAMYDIFSTTNPDRQREALVTAAMAHVATAPCELMELDVHWETNWWNQRPRMNYVQQDVALAHELLKDDPRALAEFDLCHEDAAQATVDFVAHLKAAGVWGEHAPLPQSPQLTTMVVRALIATKSATPQDALRVWGDALEARLAATPTDRLTLDLLASLYAHVDDKAHLKQVDLHGWKTLHIRLYAESYVAGRLRENEPVDADLDAAFAEFPDSDRLALYRFQRTKPGDGDVRRRALRDMVIAAFPNVANPHPAGLRLNDFMSTLSAIEITDK